MPTGTAPIGSTRHVSGTRTPIGYQQITSLATATNLTLPANASYVVVICESSTATDYVRWRDDGVAPTAGVGMPLLAGQELDYSGDLNAIQFIVASGSPKLNCSFYFP